MDESAMRNPDSKLWSHKVAQNPELRDSGEVEVLRRRFSNSIVILLPLSCGRIAIMGADRQLVSILDEVPNLEALADYSQAFESRFRQSLTASESRYLGEPSDRDLERDIKRKLRESELPLPAGPVDW